MFHYVNMIIKNSLIFNIYHSTVRYSLNSYDFHILNMFIGNCNWIYLRPGPVWLPLSRLCLQVLTSNDFMEYYTLSSEILWVQDIEGFKKKFIQHFFIIFTKYWNSLMHRLSQSYVKHFSSISSNSRHFKA